MNKDINKFLIKRTKREEIPEIVKIYLSNFHGMKRTETASNYISTLYNAYPIVQYFSVKSSNDRTIGYICWFERGGYRTNAVFELEQIAMLPNLQGRGIGTRLVVKSLQQIMDYLRSDERKEVLGGSLSRLKNILVTTGVENRAQRLYKKTLGAKVSAVLPDWYRGDEAVMTANVNSILNAWKNLGEDTEPYLIHLEP